MPAPAIRSHAGVSQHRTAVVLSVQTLCDRRDGMGLPPVAKCRQLSRDPLLSFEKWGWPNRGSAHARRPLDRRQAMMRRSFEELRPQHPQLRAESGNCAASGTRSSLRSAATAPNAVAPDQRYDSNHVLATHVPVEERFTALNPDLPARACVLKVIWHTRPSRRQSKRTSPANWPIVPSIR